MTEIGLLGALFGGILSLVSPCSALLLPSFFAYAFDRVGRLAARTGLFYLGLATILVPLGAGVGALGSLLTEYRGVATTIGGVVLIVLGLAAIFGKGFAFTPAQRASSRIRISSNVSVYLLGTVYGLAGFCSGPLLGAVLTVAMTEGQSAYGAVLMAVYAAGMALPLFLIAMLWDRFKLGNRSWLRGREITLGPLRTHTTSLVSGLLFIGIGILFLVTDGTANLGGLVGVDTEYGFQENLSSISDAISDTTMILVVLLIVVAALLARIVWRRNHAQDADAADSAGSADSADTAGADGDDSVPAAGGGRGAKVNPDLFSRSAVKAAASVSADSGGPGGSSDRTEGDGHPPADE